MQPLNSLDFHLRVGTLKWHENFQNFFLIQLEFGKLEPGYLRIHVLSKPQSLEILPCQASVAIFDDNFIFWMFII